MPDNRPATDVINVDQDAVISVCLSKIEMAVINEQ